MNIGKSVFAWTVVKSICLNSVEGGLTFSATNLDRISDKFTQNVLLRDIFTQYIAQNILRRLKGIVTIVDKRKANYPLVMSPFLHRAKIHERDTCATRFYLFS